MKLVSRDFTSLEKLVLLALTLVLIGMGYYRFIDQPIRLGIEEAHAQRDKLEIELNNINIRISEYNNRVEELAEARELRQSMPSYNASEEELRILNDVLSAADLYSFSVDKITLEGNQIRRTFAFSITAPNFATAKGIFSRLSNSRVRCLIGDVECGGLNATDGASVILQANGAFYETLVDAESDVALDELLNAQERSIPLSSDQSEDALAA